MVAKRKRMGEAAGDRKRRDSVQSLRYISSLDSYISCSQKGAISLWTGQLRLQSCIDINEPAWVTGCDYLPGMRRVACCTERSIAIWDSRAKGKNQSIFIIKPIEHSPQCMVSIPNSNGGPEDKILYGDDQGYVNLLTILAKDLTMKNSKGDNKRSQNSQSYVIEPSKLSHHIIRKKLHDDWVLKVKYFPDLRCFASCSPSSNLSFCLEEVDKIFHLNEESRAVAIPKGVNCFDFCARANIIATGGVDKVIRVWHPHIFSRPTGKLMGHLFTIIDIAMNERDQHIISLSTARVFRVWDIHTLTCLQVFTDNEERPGEKRIYSMIFDNKHERLLTGSSVIDTWPLTRAVQDTMQVPHTHDRPVAQILYNKELNQVVSACTESVIKVWEMDSGKLVYSIPEAHGPNMEVTILALDKTGYRLVSGAFDGSLKVWDFGAGQLIKAKLNPSGSMEEDLSVTGLVCNKSGDDYYIIAAGWNNKLRMYLDSHDNNDLVLLRDFSDFFVLLRERSSLAGTSSPKSQSSLSARDPFPPTDPLPDIGQPKAQVTRLTEKECQLLLDHELTCMTVVTPDLIATGCNNGNIIFWSIEKSRVDKVYILPKEVGNKAKTGTDRKVNEIKLLVHKVRKLDPAYFKKMTRHRKSDIESISGKSNMSKKSRSSLSDKPLDPQIHEEASKQLEELAAKVEGEEGSQDEQKEKTEEGMDEVDSGEGKGDGDETDIDRVAESNQPEAKQEGSSTVDESVPTKTEDEEEGEGEEAPADVNSSSHMIVETFEPIIVSLHQDSFARFWDMDGVILREISPLTRRQGIPVTSLCHDEDVNILVIGDNKGYLTLWDVKQFLEDPETEDSNCLKQQVCWRAHMSKIVSLVYVDAQKAILSSSMDGSVRLWWGMKGRFVGFFGQHRPFNFPSSEDTGHAAVLPYDISEGPLAPVKRKSASHKIRSVQRFEYPLMFDKERWEPFRRSAYMSKRDQVLRPEDKKFFGALIKPKAYNSHLESFTTAEKNTGAVFRALPVYRVVTPKKPKTPDISFKISDDDDDNMYGKHHGGGHSKYSPTKLHPGQRQKPGTTSRNANSSLRGGNPLSRTSLLSPFPRAQQTTRLSHVSSFSIRK
ncbi:WD repeat-containing protein 64 [Aplysia californica]|uniref:WD repeat-containing protein 64 n=1 Tax=Aplysia californica TaxID=6500 RepID=A0ABM1VVI6_APLCA|nr:WD repeat-containing protein 64 [Aplysia californica]